MWLNGSKKNVPTSVRKMLRYITADRLYRIFIYDIIFLLTTVELTETKRNENGYQWHEKKTAFALGIFV